jgi:hypothetical protein
MASSVSWTPFCGVNGKSHENLIYCPHCQVRNPHVSFTPTNSVRSQDVVEISDSPPRTQEASQTQTSASITTTSGIAPRFASYSQGAEALRQTHTIQRTPIVRSKGRANPTPPSVNSNFYRAVVIFYLLQYQIFKDEGLTQVTNCTSLRTFPQIPRFLMTNNSRANFSSNSFSYDRIFK